MAVLPAPLSWIRRILSILKSNLSPTQIALAFALGVFAGLPPMGLHVLIPCTLALLVRCSLRSFLISMGLFKLLSLAAAPLSHALGRWLLDASRGWDGFWRWLTHLPVLAPMGYGRYLLLGSLVVSFVIAVPVFLLVRRAVMRYRSNFTSWVSGWRVSRWLKKRRGIGLVRRFLAGGDLRYLSTPAPRGPFRYLRKEMLIGLPIVYAVCYLAAAAIVPFFAGSVMTGAASWVVGSEVAVESSSFNLFTGRLLLDEFSVQDPKAPEMNLVEIPRMEVDASMLPLLSKRVVFDNVGISDVSLHVVREEDGTLNIDNAGSGWNIEGYVEWAAQEARNVDWLGLLRRFVDYLGQIRPLAPRTDPYARYAGGRSFPYFHAPFSVRRLEIGRVIVTLEDRLDSGGPLPDLSLFEVELSNLAFPADLRRDPIEVRLRGVFAGDPGSGFAFSARFEEGEEPRSSFVLEMTRIDLPRLARFYRTTLPVDILSGTATFTAEAVLSGGEAAGVVSLLLEELRIAERAGSPLFGLSPWTSARVVEGINRYCREIPMVVGFAVGGAAAAPTLEWEAAILAVARDGLLMLGTRELRATIEELGLRIDVLGGVDEGLIDPDYAALQEHAKQAATSIMTEAAGEFLEDLLPARLEADGDASSSEAPPESLLRFLQDLVDSQNSED